MHRRFRASAKQARPFWAPPVYQDLSTHYDGGRGEGEGCCSQAKNPVPCGQVLNALVTRCVTSHALREREFSLTLMSFPPDYLAFTGPWIVPLAFLSSILASAA